MSATKYREIIRLHSLGNSPTEIAASIGCDRKTAKRAIELAEESGLVWPLPNELGDVAIKRLLYPKKYGPRGQFLRPDYEWVHRELKRKGVTRTLLYEEYCDSCKATGKNPCSQSTFNNDYAKWATTRNVTMHIKRRPAEKMEVDWAGTKMQTTDRTTAELLDVYVFVACLPFSGKLYAEGFFAMDSECWLTAHVHAFDYYGGVPAELVSDNCKTAVTKHTRDQVVINKAYSDLAAYYGCAVMPARVRQPKDKANVEIGVGIITRQVIASFRDRVFFSLGELNAALIARVEEINNMQFAKKPTSRNSIFETQEKDVLSALPATAFSVCSWERATVRGDYHVALKGNFYSVPFEHAKRVVDIRSTMQSVEIFCSDVRIASHIRSFGEGEFITSSAHMPENHKSYLEWNADGLLKQAGYVGDATKRIMAILMGSQDTKHKSLGQGMRITA